MARFAGLLLLASRAQAEELAAPMMLHSPTLVTAAPPLTLQTYQCDLGKSDDWPEAQRTWCCEHKEIGCPSSQQQSSKTASTTKAASLPTAKGKGAKVWTWSQESTSGKPGEHASTTPKERKALRSVKPTTTRPTTTPRKTTTTKLITTTTVPPTTTTQLTCDSPCTVNGVTATCKDQILQASMSDFLGSIDSCQVAQEVTAEACPVCASCPAEAVGCGVLELSTTRGPTTTIPAGNPCNAVCTLGEQPATCNARIKWSVEHVFANKPKACAQAHEMVLHQCSVCNLCKVEQTKCGETAPSANTDEIFDCSSGAAIEWASAKQAWCCEHHMKACDLMPRSKQQVFFQKKVSDEHVVTSVPSSRSSTATAFASLGLLGCAALVYRASVRGRQRSFMDEGDRAILSE